MQDSVAMLRMEMENYANVNLYRPRCISIASLQIYMGAIYIHSSHASNYPKFLPDIFETHLFRTNE